MTSSPPISNSNIQYTHLMRHKTSIPSEDPQDPDTHHIIQLIPLIQDCMMFICFACLLFVLTVLCNLNYESNFIFILLTYHSHCSTLFSNRYTTNMLTLDNTSINNNINSNYINNSPPTETTQAASLSQINTNHDFETHTNNLTTLDLAA